MSKDFGLQNLTTNQTATDPDIMESISEVLGAEVFGSYGAVGITLLAVFSFALYKANVSLDVGATFMIPTIFTLGYYGLLPGGGGLTFSIAFGLIGMIAFGLFRYFR